MCTTTQTATTKNYQDIFGEIQSKDPTQHLTEQKEKLETCHHFILIQINFVQLLVVF